MTRDNKQYSLCSFRLLFVDELCNMQNTRGGLNSMARRIWEGGCQPTRPSISWLEELVGLQGSIQAHHIFNELLRIESRARDTNLGPAGLQPSARIARAATFLPRSGLALSLSRCFYPQAAGRESGKATSFNCNIEQYGGGVS